MLGIRKYIIGLVIGLVIGLWAGVNIGKGRPIWANPFTEPSIAQKVKDTATDVLKDAKKAARDSLSD